MLNTCTLQIWNGKSQKVRTYLEKLDMSSTQKVQMTALVTQNQITDLSYIRLQIGIVMKGKGL